MKNSRTNVYFILAFPTSRSYQKSFYSFRFFPASHDDNILLFKLEHSTPDLLHCDINDADILIGLVSFGIDFNIRDSLNNFHSFSHSSKHAVFVV